MRLQVADLRLEPSRADATEVTGRTADDGVRVVRAVPPGRRTVRCCQLAVDLARIESLDGEGIGQRAMPEPRDVPQPVRVGEGQVERVGDVEAVRPVLGE